MAQTSQYKTVTIPLGANEVSTEIPYGMSLRGVVTPSVWEATTVTFEVAQEAAGPFVPLFENGTRYTLTTVVNSNRYAGIDKPDLFIGHKYIKIIHNVSGSPSNVSAARIVGLNFASE